MTPITTAFDGTRFSATHVSLLVVVASVTMVTVYCFRVIAFAIVDVWTVVGLCTLHWNEGEVLHVPCGRCCLLLIVIKKKVKD